MKGTRLLVMGAATLALSEGAASAGRTEFAVNEEVRGRIEALLGKNGAKLNYFPGPGDTVGVGVSMPNGKQMVVYGSALRLDNRLPSSRVREFKHTSPPQVLYDVVFADGTPQPAIIWIAFGGDRVAKLQ